MAKSTKKPLSKSAVLQAVTDAVGDGLSRKHAKAVVEALVAVGHKALKKSGVFVVPGFGKFTVEEAGQAGPRRHQSLDQGEADVRGKAGEQGRAGAGAEGGEGRGSVIARLRRRRRRG